MDQYTEKIIPDYWDIELFKQEAEIVFRYNAPSGRMYFRVDDEGQKHWYISVTNALKKVMPTSEYLIKWIAQMGEHEAERYKNAAADYGTMLHIFFGMFLYSGKLNFDNIANDIQNYVNDKPSKYIDLTSKKDDLTNDLASLVQWVHDYEVVPRAIEVVVYSDELGLAGAVDLICEMNAKHYKKTPKDKRERVVAMVDLKSGKKGFSPSYAVQLAIYRRLWQYSYPGLPVPTVIANLAPKDWRGDTPTYSFDVKKEENYPDIACIDEYASILKKKLEVKPPTRRVIKGSVGIGQSMNGLVSYDAV